jgi:mannose-6-phosphate isomerase
MAATRLNTKRVEKPWGRTTLWPGFDNVPEGGKPVGEVWFEVPGRKDFVDGSPDLLIKYLFTSDKLSVQVHPDDKRAQAKGMPRGKSEAWVILDAEAQASIALGTTRVMEKDELRKSAEDGSIEQLLDWKPVKKDDSLGCPAGTIHAIGPGLTLIEVQQNSDTTYRLYDYGSGRELHLDDGVEASDPVPYVAPYKPHEQGAGREILDDGPAFVLERWTETGKGRLNGDGRPVWLVPIAGQGTIDGQTIKEGEAWLVDDGKADLELGQDMDLVVAYPKAGVIEGLWAKA